MSQDLYKLVVNIKKSDRTVEFGVGYLEGTESQIDEAINVLKSYIDTDPVLKPLKIIMDGGPVSRPDNPPPY